MKRTSYVLIVFIIVCFFWTLSGINPATPENWLAESKVFFWFIPLLAGLSAYLRLSKTSVTLIAVFLILHGIGMYYNYGFVPIGKFFGQLVGTERNFYDRFVHLTFGLLMVFPIREMLLRVKGVHGFFSYFVPFNIIMSASAIFEIMEWSTVSNLAASVGFLFIGGNDPFDAVKDMAMAGIGSLVALLFIFIRYVALTKNVMGKMKRAWREHRAHITRTPFRTPL